jgi:hypothetical protein
MLSMVHTPSTTYICPSSSYFQPFELRKGYFRGADPTLELPQVLDKDLNNNFLSDMIEIDGRREATSEDPERGH